MREFVRRWSVGLLATLTLLGTGLVYADPTLLMAALIPLAYVVYGTLSRAPDAGSLSISRSITPSTPEPGGDVEVTLTVRNEGEDILPDVRVLDGVPDELALSAGSARLGTPLSPGESEECSYTVVARRGEYEFGEPAVRLRSLAAGRRVTRTVPAAGDSVVTCTTTAGDAPLQQTTANRRGALTVDSGGPGQEFYATRQYKRGDPVNRIDWHHVAKTGEFVTVQYRKEQAARTVLIVDARPLNRVAAGPGSPTGAGMAAYAGERLYDALTAAGVRTSVTAVGVDDGAFDALVGPDGLPWVDPGNDRGRRGQASVLLHRLQTEGDGDVGPLSLAFPAEVFESGGAAAWAGPGPGSAGGSQPGSGTVGAAPADQAVYPGARADGGGTEGWRGGLFEDGELDGEIRALLSRLPADTQVVLCSPLLDNWPVALGSALTMREYPLVVVSPNVVDAPTPGQRLAGVARRARLRALRRMGVETVDWRTDAPIDYALRRSLPHLLSQP